MDASVPLGFWYYGGQTMLTKRTASFVVLLGIGLLIVSLTADITGIGDDNKFGLRQVMGTVVGALVAIVGLYIMFKRSQAGGRPNK